MNIKICDLSSFKAFLAFLDVKNVEQLKATDSNFSAVISVKSDKIAYLKQFLTYIKPYKVYEKKDQYKIYLNRENLVIPATITHFTKDNKADMRFKANKISAIQELKNVIFTDTIEKVKVENITPYKRIIFVVPQKRFTNV